jgi:hypothetical protein
MKCLRPLKHWDCGFESHMRHVCLSKFSVCVSLRRWRPCIGLIRCPKNLTDCLQDSQFQNSNGNTPESLIRQDRGRKYILRFGRMDICWVFVVWFSLTCINRKVCHLCSEETRAPLPSQYSLTISSKGMAFYSYTSFSSPSWRYRISFHINVF